MKVIDNSKVFPSKQAPFGMQRTGGIQNKPELIYPEDGWKWPELNKPMTTVVRIEKNAYVEEKSTLKIAEGVSDKVLSGIDVKADEPSLNGIYLEYTEGYTVKDCKLDLSGVGEDDFAGVGAGVLVNRKSDVVLENLDIHMAGAARSCTASTGGSNVIVRNCKLVADGGPLPEDYVPCIGPGMLEPPSGLDIGGTSRCHLSMDNSKTYFYDSYVEADGWAGLSTDAGNGYVYLEANNCDVVVKNSGYGVYSDGDCHVVLNNCRVNSGSHTAILAGECDLALNNCDCVAARYLAMVHDVHGIDTEIGQLVVRGGKYETGAEALLLRSCNTYIDLVGTKIESKTGVLARAIFNPDDHRTPVGEKDVFGNNIVMTHMNACGDLLNEDPQRCMKVTLDNSNLSGAIVKAYLTMNAGSKWTATGESTVVLIGECRPGQFDAAEGVTINAEAGEGCPLSGEYKLASGGTLVVA